MSYEPTTWKSGDTVTSAKLNKMEQGIANAGGGGLVVTDTEGTLNKTWQEIHDAALTGVVAVLNMSSETTFSITFVEYVGESGGEYYLDTMKSTSYLTDSADGYPVIQQD